MVLYQQEDERSRKEQRGEGRRREKRADRRRERNGEEGAKKIRTERREERREEHWARSTFSSGGPQGNHFVGAFTVLILAHMKWKICFELF